MCVCGSVHLFLCMIVRLRLFLYLYVTCAAYKVGIILKNIHEAHLSVWNCSSLIGQLTL